MNAEYSTSVDQTIQPGGAAFFDLAPVPCRAGLVYHRQGGTQFRLASPALMNVRRRCCCRMPNADYDVSFHGNVAVPEGGAVTAGISLQLALDGAADPGSLMLATPAAVGDFANVGADIVVEVPWICRCSSVALVNTGTEPVTLRAGATIKFGFSGVTN